MQQCVRDFADGFGRGPAVHVLRAVIPERDDAVAVAGDDRVGRQVDQRRLLPQTGRLQGHLFDIEQDHHGAVDPVIGGPEGMDAQQMMASFAVANFALADLHGVDDLGNQRFEIRDVDRRPEVADRPADVVGQHVEYLGRRGRVATDAQVGGNRDHRYISAGEQVVDVVVEPGELGVANLELLVDRGQLLIDRLQLLFRGLELFVRALQLLVGRKYFFVGRFQLLVRRILIFDRRLQVFARGRQLAAKRLRVLRFGH